MFRFHRRIGCVLAWALLSVFFSCAAPDAIVTKDEENAPAKLMEEGLYNLEKGYYVGASESFQKIVDRYPYSKYSVEAELKLADALFLKESYDEALENYHEFQRLHPKNPKIPYIIYQNVDAGSVLEIVLDHGGMDALAGFEFQLVERFSVYIVSNLHGLLINPGADNHPGSGTRPMVDGKLNGLAGCQPATTVVCILAPLLDPNGG